MQQPEFIQTSEIRETAVAVRAETPVRLRRDSGAMLLAVLFMMALMVIAALAVAPSFLQQAKRDREEEMIHRGTEYARGIKKFYKKFGRYPSNLEQLENTNQIKFLRRRYKDPLAKDGQWKLLRYTDIQMLVGAGGFGLQGIQPGMQQGAPGMSGGQQSITGQSGLTGSDQGAGTAPAGAQLSPQQQSGFLGGRSPGAAPDGAQPGVAPSDAGGSSIAGGGSGGAGGPSGLSLGSTPGQTGNTAAGQVQGQGATGQTGSNNTIFGNTGVGGQTFGGGAIVGVASKSKDPTIREYNKKKNYDEWQFIYSPMLDRQNTLLRGPYNGQTMIQSQIGTPAGQMNQTNQSIFGQQPGGVGQQQPTGLGQQNPQQNQPIAPTNQFPPDQTQPQQ